MFLELFEKTSIIASHLFVLSNSPRYKQKTFPFFAQFGQFSSRIWSHLLKKFLMENFIFLHSLHFFVNYIMFLRNSYSVAPSSESTLKYETPFRRIDTIELVSVTTQVKAEIFYTL